MYHHFSGISRGCSFRSRSSKLVSGQGYNIAIAIFSWQFWIIFCGSIWLDSGICVGIHMNARIQGSSTGNCTEIINVMHFNLLSASKTWQSATYVNSSFVHDSINSTHWVAGSIEWLFCLLSAEILLYFLNLWIILWIVDWKITKVPAVTCYGTFWLFSPVQFFTKRWCLWNTEPLDQVSKHGAIYHPKLYCLSQLDWIVLLASDFKSHKLFS